MDTNSIFSPIIDEELHDIILHDLYEQNPIGNDLRDVERIINSYNLQVPTDRLDKTLEELRKQYFIRRDPKDKNIAALTDSGIDYVRHNIKPKISSILNLELSYIESLIKSEFNIQEFRLEKLGDGYKVLYFPESRLSDLHFTAFRIRNSYFTLESNPPILLYRRSDISAIYRAFERWLILLKEQNRSITNRESQRAIYALSTKKEDSHLRSEGLLNKGLLGYLNNSNDGEKFGLEQFLLTFQKGLDYFYTLDNSKERFENLKPINKGILGYARKTPDTKYHQLFRFFNKKNQQHIFVVNPDLVTLSKDGFLNESSDHPVYVKAEKINDDIPLYLYSNTNTNYFTPILESGNSDTNQEEFPRQYLKELDDLIRNNSIDRSRISIRHEIKSSATIELTETTLNFYFNIQRNKEYFTVLRNPQSGDAAYLINDLKTWSDVKEGFVNWLQFIKNEVPDIVNNAIEEFEGKVEINESFTLNIKRRIYSSVNISIGDSVETEPALGVEALANEMVKIIKNLKSEPGNMTGIFAQWGRGKTRLMNEIWKRLSGEINGADVGKKKEIEYIQIKYQAWRYQDTPASWAYLYEQFSLKFLGDKKGFKNFFVYHWRLVSLNIEREGIWSLIGAVGFSCLAVLGLWLMIPVGLVDNTLLTWIGVPFLGIIIGVGVKNFRLDYFTKAINLIKKYGIKASFNKTLGIQAEIQKELIHLVNAWVKPDKKRKLVLFVDDLDRCNEAKTIEIIDALRIMLDDEELKDKLLVITAIDERILKLAVTKKYENATSVYDSNELVREYIDKLFIFSVKLGVLNEVESQEFFEKFVKVDTGLDLENKAKKGSENNKDAVEKRVTEEVPKLNDDDLIKKLNEPEQFLSPQVPTSDKNELEKIDKLSTNEIKIFRKKLRYIHNSTPRKIRIIYYRYLFARNLLILSHGNENENCYWLSEPFHEIFIQLLISFSQKPTSYIIEERKKVLESQDVIIRIESGLDELVNKSEYLELLKVFELTVAY